MTPRFSALLAPLLALALLSGCGVPERDPAAPPEELADKAEPAGYSNIRSWGDSGPTRDSALVADYRSQIRKSARSNGSIDILAISGGGADGAYGAGFLTGWSARGNRPEFDIVTGISTGALIAPFAFLGSDFDDRLQALFTNVTTFDLLDLNLFSALFGGPSLADTGPLKKIIARELNADVIAAISREHEKGRRLYIGTTNLDAQRPVIWDIGRIAASGNPGAAQLIRKIILASATVPGGFPPVMMDVVAEGSRYQEMHVDGSVTQSIFIYPPALPMQRILTDLGLTKSRKTFWLIRNTDQRPEYATSEPGVIGISTRAMLTLVKSQGNANLRQIATIARRDGFAFRLTAIPASFKVKRELGFNSEYMNSLYQEGVRNGRSKSPWLTGINDALTH